MELKLFFKNTFPNLLELDELVDKTFKQVIYPKGTILVKAKKFSTKLFFIEKGLIRTSFLNDDKDMTHKFFDENDFCGALDCIFYNESSKFTFEVLEETTVQETDYKTFKLNFMKLEEMRQFESKAIMDILRQSSDKLIGTHTKSALDRYNFMIKKYPNILLRAKLGHIASYLGVTQQTLSVIRGMRS